MAKFVGMFIEPSDDEKIGQLVLNIFDKYDTNRSGYLEKREAFRLINDVLASKG